MNPKRSIRFLFKWEAIFPFFSCVCIVFLLLTDFLYFSVDLSIFIPNHLVLDYLIKFLLFIIPATITIFTFVYREKKDASYTNIKTSNIVSQFINTIIIEFGALIFAIRTSINYPTETEAKIIGYPNYYYNFSIIFAGLTITALLLFSYLLFKHMDIHVSLKQTYQKNIRLHNHLKYLINKTYWNPRNDYLFDSYKYLLESNYQLIISAISKKNFSNIEAELKQTFALTKDFYQTFIDTSDLQYTSVFSIEKDHNSFLVKGKNLFTDIFQNRFFQKDAVPQNYNEKFVDIYKTILHSYEMLIREASNNHVTEIQKLAYLEFAALNPIKVYEFDLNVLTEEEFIEINNFYQELARCYNSALFHTIKEFSDEKTVEYTYLLNYITSTMKFFEAVNLFRDKRSEKEHTFYSSFINKEIILVESLVVRAVENDNVKFLTESTRLLLDLFYSTVQKPEDVARTISTKLGASDERFKKYVNLPIDKPEGIKFKGIYKKTIAQEIIRIIVHALYKSIELNHYSCSGYLIKISASHITLKNYLEVVKVFAQKIIERQNLFFDFDYYHYSFNGFSKIHCIQKMILLLSYQFIYKFGLPGKTDLEELLKIIFLNNKEDMEYMVEKIEAAGKSYGMISICEDTSSIIKSIFITDLIKKLDPNEFKIYI
ncbi:hypothetical protein [Peribacillus glennii]|uniref:Uncharacterized protein n=1 Tax=Peribacillus glennii TaxID=2303991 RepID=A0A372L6N2_9BACI|nr:hypothetical protein [Peribacillus glennii]RFU60736.1 hypothetical protein D0466_20495 [Peribacillus glennii]